MIVEVTKGGGNGLSVMKVYVFYLLISIGSLFIFEVIEAGAQADRFSMACDKIRTNAMLSYFAKQADPKVARLAGLLVGYENLDLNLALIAEALSGRIAVEQFEDSVLVGLDSVDNSPGCDEQDRERSTRARSLLPSILSDIRASVRRMSGQD